MSLMAGLSLAIRDNIKKERGLLVKSLSVMPLVPKHFPPYLIKLQSSNFQNNPNIAHIFILQLKRLPYMKKKPCYIVTLPFLKSNKVWECSSELIASYLRRISIKHSLSNKLNKNQQKD